MLSHCFRNFPFPKKSANPRIGFLSCRSWTIARFQFTFNSHGIGLLLCLLLDYVTTEVIVFSDRLYLVLTCRQYKPTNCVNRYSTAFVFLTVKKIPTINDLPGSCFSDRFRKRLDANQYAVSTPI